MAREQDRIVDQPRDPRRAAWDSTPRTRSLRYSANTLQLLSLMAVSRKRLS